MAVARGNVREGETVPLHKQVYVPTPTISQPGPWQASWPSNPDFNFNFYQFLDRKGLPGAVAQAPNPVPRIAIVGAGVAGLTALRELFCSGYTSIDVFEASDRIGGRTWSRPVNDSSLTVYEMGAMRMPFFSQPGRRNCVLDFYREIWGIQTAPFPDPAAVWTGIYMNNGWGPPEDSPPPQPTMLRWAPSSGTPVPPPSPSLKKIFDTWNAWATSFTGTAANFYGTPNWDAFWQGVAKTYWTLNFRELAYLPTVTDPTRNEQGDFGGLGFDEDQAELFYVIGAGDGSWGAFYDVSALYVIRTLLFGYGTNHQLILELTAKGKFTPQSSYQDSVGHPLSPPMWKGVQCFAEGLFYIPLESPFIQTISPYEAAQPGSPYPNLRVYTQTPVEGLSWSSDGKPQLTVNDERTAYDAVILTTTTWAAQMGIDMSTASVDVLPYKAQQSLKESHWITSCKVFYPLKERYWLPADNPQIPQVITTDTFIQDVYGYSANDSDPGVVLVSYTWEDDASKLEAYGSDEELAARCLEELDLILRWTNQPPMSPFVDETQPVVIHWERQPTYHACAKLYRQRSWDADYALLTYNQNWSAKSGLYFAGEGYSLEGGWTEPAFRLAVDALIHVVKNTGGSFRDDFDFDADYPTYSNWSPNQPQ